MLIIKLADREELPQEINKDSNAYLLSLEYLKKIIFVRRELLRQLKKRKKEKKIMDIECQSYLNKVRDVTSIYLCRSNSAD